MPALSKIKMTSNKTIDAYGKIVRKMARIVANRPLAEAIYRSVDTGLRCASAHIANDKTVWGVFKHSLDAAIRDIKEHPRGKLFQRLLEYGTPRDDPEVLISDGKTFLSDPECGSCVDFIYSHMINRFKGELAELLALGPCLSLIHELKQKGHISSLTHLYWGDMIQEPRQINPESGNSQQWGSFTKGADGLLIEKVRNVLKIEGVIEVKSMFLAKKRVLAQINKHIARLRGGVKLKGRLFPPDNIQFSSGIRIIVLPSSWHVSRKWRRVETERGWQIVFPKNSEPPIQTQAQELEPDLWKITLAWSQEALHQAAFQMTFWYMAQVGRNVYTKQNLPGPCSYMTPAEAGQNTVKQELYYIPLRYISERQQRLAIKLYNVYGYGYPLGVDAQKILTKRKGMLWRNEILWPEDILGEDEG